MQYALKEIGCATTPGCDCLVVDLVSKPNHPDTRKCALFLGTDLSRSVSLSTPVSLVVAILTMMSNILRYTAASAWEVKFQALSLEH